MGREIRRVPPNWEHPKKEHYNVMTRQAEERYQPLYDRDFEGQMREWLDDLDKWLKGEFNRVRAEPPDLNYSIDEPYRSFVNWGGNAPDPEYYRPKWSEEEATWFQAYETVSEGTPVSPPFATTEELAQYLAANGDFWYQKDQEEGRSTFRTKPTLAQARAFVGDGFAMTIVLTADKQLLGPYEQGVTA